MHSLESVKKYFDDCLITTFAKGGEGRGGDGRGGEGRGGEGRGGEGRGGEGREQYLYNTNRTLSMVSLVVHSAEDMLK